ncbi:MAG: hypothetical protein ACR2QM_07945 [Longimicrobiales bacterium]
MNETIEYLAERYPDLGVAELGELKTVGLRFCKPVISRRKKEEAPAEDATETTAEDQGAEASEAPASGTPVAAGEAAPAAESEEAAEAEVPVDGTAAVGAA